MSAAEDRRVAPAPELATKSVELFTRIGALLEEEGATVSDAITACVTVAGIAAAGPSGMSRKAFLELAESSYRFGEDEQPR